jgi:hypothetical protein
MAPNTRMRDEQSHSQVIRSHTHAPAAHTLLNLPQQGLGFIRLLTYQLSTRIEGTLRVAVQVDASQTDANDACLPRRPADKICTSFSLGTTAASPPSHASGSGTLAVRAVHTRTHPAHDLHTPHPTPAHDRSPNRRLHEPVAEGLCGR